MSGYSIKNTWTLLETKEMSQQGKSERWLVRTMSYRAFFILKWLDFIPTLYVVLLLTHTVQKHARFFGAHGFAWPVKVWYWSTVVSNLRRWHCHLNDITLFLWCMSSSVSLKFWCDLRDHRKYMLSALMLNDSWANPSQTLSIWEVSLTDQLQSMLNISLNNPN